jgi:hypothetical protein
VGAIALGVGLVADVGAKVGLAAAVGVGCTLWVACGLAVGPAPAAQATTIDAKTIAAAIRLTQ